jgi:hypothetical protein
VTEVFNSTHLHDKETQAWTRLSRR